MNEHGSAYFVFDLVYILILLQNAFLPWDGGCRFDCSHLLLFKYVNMECQEIWWKMGTDKFICFAIHYPSWTCLLLLVRGTIIHNLFKLIRFCAWKYFCFAEFFYCRLSFALWPIWSFLSLPLLVYVWPCFWFCMPFYAIFYMGGNCLITPHCCSSHCLWLAWLYSPTFWLGHSGHNTTCSVQIKPPGMDACKKQYWHRWRVANSNMGNQ